MLRTRKVMVAYWLSCLLALPIVAQNAGADNPHPYRGLNTFMDGVFVTPVPDVPFSAVAELETTQSLPDGTSETRKTINNIARDLQGRIYNERRSLVPASFTGTPPILSSHIFDPETRLNTFLNPFTRVARQTTLPPRPATESVPGPAHNPLVKEEDLGTNIMENVAVHGVRRTRTIPATLSGTGKEVVVTDEYWYSEELHLNMLVKHSDPRTGQQTVTVTHVNRTEPDPAIFQVPSGYKIVDETPAN